MSSRLLPISLSLVAGCLAHAEVRLSTVIGDNAVLQRDMKIPIWGEADPGESITVAFAGQTKKGKADRFGRWRVELDPMPASAEGRPLSIEAATGQLTVSKVILGDVWLYIAASFHLQEKAGPHREWEPAFESLPPISFCRRSDIFEQRTHSHRPQAEFLPDAKGGSWKLFQPPGKYFDNRAFPFGVGLGRETKVPVGVIGLGGNFLDALTPPQGFQYYPPELKEFAERVALWDPSTPQGKKAYLESIAAIRSWAATTRDAMGKADVTIRDLQPAPLVPGGPAFERAPTSQYNNILHRFMPAAVRGVIIELQYHDVGDPHYEAKLAALIRGLREVMHQKDAPVCVVQMHSPGQYNRLDEVEPANWPETRQAQANVMTQLSKVTTVASYDNDPKRREFIATHLGMRTAKWAAAIVANEPVKTGPILKRAEAAGRTIKLSFGNAGAGLMAGRRKPMNPDVEPAGETAVAGFEVAAADGTWHEAEAEITGPDTVTVSRPEGAAPAAVRYAWAVAPADANLYNKGGFPALPFRREL